MDLTPVWNAIQDLVARVTNLEGVPVSTSGWMRSGSVWVYVSATSFKVVGVDVTAQFPVGTKLRCKQGAGYLYFYVVSAAFGSDTTVTITGGSDYSLANATITDNYYSYQDTPQGFPGSFAWSPTFSSSGASFTYSIQYGRFSVQGAKLHFDIYLKESGSAPSGTTTNYDLGIVLPVVAFNTTNNHSGFGLMCTLITLDSGYFGFCGQIDLNSNLLTIREMKSGAATQSLTPGNILANGAFGISGDYHIG